MNLCHKNFGKTFYEFIATTELSIKINQHLVGDWSVKIMSFVGIYFLIKRYSTPRTWANQCTLKVLDSFVSPNNKYIYRSKVLKNVFLYLELNQPDKRFHLYLYLHEGLFFKLSKRTISV